MSVASRWKASPPNPREGTRSVESGKDRKRPLSTNAVETLLRDAAAFESDADVPEGLAYRALARQIAQQTARERDRELSDRRRSRVTALLGGLSIGTLAGAAAAVFLCLHTGTSFVPAPRASSNADVALSPPYAEPASNPNSLKLAQPTLQVTPPRRLIDGETQEPHLVAEALRPWQERATHKETPEGARRSNSDSNARNARLDRPSLPMAMGETSRHMASPSGLESVAYHAAKARPSHNREEPVVAQWQTETVDQTAYQLVSTGYVATPAEDGNGEAVVTPVQLQAGIEPTGGSDSPAPSALH